MRCKNLFEIDDCDGSRCSSLPQYYDKDYSC